MQSWLQANLIVRADVGQQNKPSLADQQAVVTTGASLIQNDYPWHAYNNDAPLRPGIAIDPEELAADSTINEPGHRILFVQNPGGVGLPTSGGRAIAAARLSGTPSTRWETYVSSTRPTTDSAEPNPHKPRGIGCIVARSAATNDEVRVCRTTAEGHSNILKPLGEDVIITVDVTRNGNICGIAAVGCPVELYSDDRDANGLGELLRLDVSQSKDRACVQAYSTELVINDVPQWHSLASTCFNAPLILQGLTAQDRDVLFVGTKMDQVNDTAAPSSAKTDFDASDADEGTFYVRNLTWPR